MNIHLIQAAPVRYKEAALKGKPFQYYAPQTLNVLASSINDCSDAAITMTDQGIEPVDENIDADIVGISTTTCAAPEAYRLARVFTNRGISTILGGSHPTVMPDEALQHAEAVAIGPAEMLWKKIISDYKKGKLHGKYSGFSHCSVIKPRYTEKRHHSYFPVDTIELTRGCSNNCSYCVINSINNSRQYTMAYKNAVEEIKKTGRRLLFLDSNPFQNTNYFREIMRILKKEKKTWGAAATIDIADNSRFLSEIKESGCIGLLIGFESVSRESVNSAGKYFNNTEQYIEAVKKIHDNGMGVLGTFTLGLEYDDKSIFKKTYELVNKAKIDLAKYGILTPLPGSRIFNQYDRQGRILTYDWSQYDTEHVVFKPGNMNAEELMDGFRYLNRETYSYRSVFSRLFRKNKYLFIDFAANMAFKYFAKDLG
ncbi:MAG: radical SAM protein [candidate division WOR-3 bacterium]|nr:radical SAM protein [candidate division WOR-3 bacterium]